MISNPKWATPIYDRQESDVQNGTPKGYLNVSDLSRIENNLGNLLDHAHYPYEYKDWTRYGFPSPVDFSRILQNAASVKALYPYISINVPPNMLRWDYANDIERLSLAAKELWDANLEWYCLERIYEDFDSLENVTWDELEQTPCPCGTIWNEFEVEFIDWDDLEGRETIWNDIDCEGDE